ncbi:hypothetical protein HN873_048114 [Arachis hypogaea]
MGKSLMEQCCMEFKALRVVNFFIRKRSNDVAVRQTIQALSGMIERKASVGGFLSSSSNARTQPWTSGGSFLLFLGSEVRLSS